MNRLLGVGLSLLVVLAACGSDDRAVDADSPLGGSITTRAPDTAAASGPVDDAARSELAARAGPWSLETEDLANAAGAPRMLVSDRIATHRVDGATPTLLDRVPSPAMDVMGDGSGLVVAEVVETADDGVDIVTGLVRIHDDSVEPIPLGSHATVDLYDLVTVDGRPHLLYGLFLDAAEVDADETGTLVLHDLVDDGTVELGTASAPELFLTAASASDALIVLSYSTDLTESVSFVDLSGEPVDRESPTDRLEYNAPPLVTGAVLSPDGNELAYIEGPDVDGTADLEEPVGDWVVVITDAGGEQIRLTVADQRIEYLTIDFDGRWILVSGGDADGPVEPLLIDSEATDVAAYLVAGVRGTASLESAAG